MKADLAILAKECVELSPAALLAIVVGARMGWVDTGFLGLSIHTSIVFPVVALVIGAWHGLLDRRHNASAFVRHRPVRDSRMQVVRACTGVAVIGLMFLAYTVSKPIAFSSLDPQVLARFEHSADKASTQAARLSVEKSIWVFIYSLAAWALTRTCVSWSGRAAALVWAVFLIPAAGAAAYSAQPWSEAFVLLLLLLCTMLSVVGSRAARSGDVA